MNMAFKNHRDYVAHLFKLKGKKVLKYAHTYSEDGSILECGLIYARSDSDIDPFMEIWGIEGVSIGPLNAA